MRTLAKVFGVLTLIGLVATIYFINQPYPAATGFLLMGPVTLILAALTLVFFVIAGFRESRRKRDED